MNRVAVPSFVAEPHRRPPAAETAPRTGAPLPAGAPRGPTPSGSGRRLPEPPTLRADPLTSPRACVSCSAPVRGDAATPRCWGCGRALCSDCYWRHGASPSAHRCPACVAAATTAAGTSGGRAVRTRSGFTPNVAPIRSD
jgi:hypothetical protein